MLIFSLLFWFNLTNLGLKMIHKIAKFKKQSNFIKVFLKYYYYSFIRGINIILMM